MYFSSLHFQLFLLLWRPERLQNITDSLYIYTLLKFLCPWPLIGEIGHHRTKLFQLRFLKLVKLQNDRMAIKIMNSSFWGRFFLLNKNNSATPHSSLFVHIFPFQSLYWSLKKSLIKMQKSCRNYSHWVADITGTTPLCDTKSASVINLFVCFKDFPNLIICKFRFVRGLSCKTCH